MSLQVSYLYRNSGQSKWNFFYLKKSWKMPFFCQKLGKPHYFFKLSISNHQTILESNCFAPEIGSETLGTKYIFICSLMLLPCSAAHSQELYWKFCVQFLGMIPEIGQETANFGHSAVIILNSEICAKTISSVFSGLHYSLMGTSSLYQALTLDYISSDISNCTLHVTHLEKYSSHPK